MKKYQHDVIVHWGDTDPAKIVFYPNYFVWFDESTRLLWDSVGLNWNVLMDKYGVIGLPIVDAQARFLLPSRFRDEIVVETSIGKWSEKTFVMNHVIYNQGNKSAEGSETRVWALRHPEDPARLKAGAIPPEIIQAFE